VDITAFAGERGGWSTMYVKGEVKDGELPR
jgi:hypothetical protein